MRPTDITYHSQSRELELIYADGSRFFVSSELLRVFSPSAEVRGHGPGQEVLQTGKESVGISAIEPVGNYAIKLVFDDGHDTGLYDWNLLYDLGANQESHWQDYLQRLRQEGVDHPALAT